MSATWGLPCGGAILGPALLGCCRQNRRSSFPKQILKVAAREAQARASSVRIYFVGELNSPAFFGLTST